MAYEEENLNQFPTALSLQHDVLFLDNQEFIKEHRDIANDLV